MLGIRTSWKRSRISKIIAVILPLPLLLLSFLLGAVRAKADSAFPQTELTQIQNVRVGYENSSCVYVNLKDVNKIYGSDTSTGTGNNYTLTEIPYGACGYYEGTVEFFVQTIQSEYSFQEKYSYYGYIQYNLSFSLNFGTATSTVTYSDLVLDSIWCSSGDDENNYTFNRSSSSGVSREGTLIVYNNFDKDKVYKFTDKEYFIAKFRVYAYLNSNTSTPNMYTNCSMNLATVGSTDPVDIAITQERLYQAQSERYYLYNINANINSQVDAINAAASQAHTDASTAHSDAVATKNAINTAASQAHTDAQTAHNDALKTQDILQNDSTSFSSGMDSLKNDVDTQQGLADTAVDNSVHNYTGALSTIDNVDYDNFFAGQSSPATFWRDVGEYVLDPSNLGQFAGGLVIVTVITLFVFMLRL